MGKLIARCGKHGETEFTPPNSNLDSFCKICYKESFEKPYQKMEIKHDVLDFSMGARESSLSEDCVSGSASMYDILIYHGNKSISDRTKKKEKEKCLIQRN